jgi:hypothetical protein
MDVSFIDSSRRKKQFKYLTFLPKNLRRLALWAVIVNFVSLVLVIIFFSSLQKQIPLFYSLPDLQQLVDKKAILILPGLASLITLVHFLIIKYFKNAHPTILHVFLLSSFILQVLILTIILRLLIILN